MLTYHKVDQISAFVARLYACHDLEGFPEIVLTELPKLVGSEHTTFNYLAPETPTVIVHSEPELPDHELRQRVFEQTLSDHTVLAHYMTSGDAGAYKLSDFQSVAEYHRTGLYKNVYHDIRYEDQISFFLFPPDSEIVGISLARDRRSFTERERRLLNVVRPHISQAYLQAEAVTRLRRELDHLERTQEAMRVAAIALDAEHRPIYFCPRAQEWISRFFPERSRDPRCLPDALAAWLRWMASDSKTMERQRLAGDVLVRDDGTERLSARLFPDRLREGGRLLVLELQTKRDAMNALRDFKITPRELDVLLQLEQGKGNDEIAAALGVSSLTIRKHLEHIFDKFGVHSRTAAVVKMHRLLSSQPGRADNQEKVLNVV